MFSLLILSRRKIFLFMIKIIMVIRQTKNYITIRIIIIIMYTYIYIYCIHIVFFIYGLRLVPLQNFNETIS